MSLWGTMPPRQVQKAQVRRGSDLRAQNGISFAFRNDFSFPCFLVHYPQAYLSRLGSKQLGSWLSCHCCGTTCSFPRNLRFCICKVTIPHSLWDDLSQFNLNYPLFSVCFVSFCFRIGPWWLELAPNQQDCLCRTLICICKGPINHLVPPKTICQRM